jgi:hypothetical protein
LQTRGAVRILGAAVAALALCYCSSAPSQCTTFARRDVAAGLSTVSGTADVEWADGTSATYLVNLGGDLSPGQCQFNAGGGLWGPVGGSAQIGDQTAHITCRDASPGHDFWQLLFQGWHPFSEAQQGEVFRESQLATLRNQGSGQIQRCDDTETPSVATLSMLESVGTYDFAGASVSLDYLRRVDIQIAAGPSKCGMASITLSLVVEQGADQFKFVDSTQLTCAD